MTTENWQVFHWVYGVFLFLYATFLFRNLRSTNSRTIYITAALSFVFYTLVLLKFGETVSINYTRDNADSFFAREYIQTIFIYTTSLTAFMIALMIIMDMKPEVLSFVKVQIGFTAICILTQLYFNLVTINLLPDQGEYGNPYLHMRKASSYVNTK